MLSTFARISVDQRRNAYTVLVKGGVVEPGGWKFNQAGTVLTTDPDPKKEILLGNIRLLGNFSKAMALQSAREMTVVKKDVSPTAESAGTSFSNTLN